VASSKKVIHRAGRRGRVCDRPPATLFDKLELQQKRDDNRRVLAVLAYLDHSA
jgi:hypothetical protein